MADFTWLQTLWTYEPDRKKPERDSAKTSGHSTRTTTEPPSKRPTGRDHGPSKN